MVNIDLKIALIRYAGSQVAASRQLGIPENKLSYIVRGHSEPNERERALLERALGRDYFSKEGQVPASRPVQDSFEREITDEQILAFNQGIGGKE